MTVCTGAGEGTGLLPTDWIAWLSCCEEPPGTYARGLYARPLPPSVSVISR